MGSFKTVLTQEDSILRYGTVPCGSRIPMVRGDVLPSDYPVTMCYVRRTESLATLLQKHQNLHFDSFSDPWKSEMKVINVYIYS
jgi:hypothetical protein